MPIGTCTEPSESIWPTTYLCICTDCQTCTNSLIKAATHLPISAIKTELFWPKIVLDGIEQNRTRYVFFFMASFLYEKSKSRKCEIWTKMKMLEFRNAIDNEKCFSRLSEILQVFFISAILMYFLTVFTFLTWNFTSVFFAPSLCISLVFLLFRLVVFTSSKSWKEALASQKSNDQLLCWESNAEIFLCSKI